MLRPYSVPTVTGGVFMTQTSSVRLCGGLVRIPSKNFQATYQLDVDCWTEFLCRIGLQDVAARRVSQ
jgi:hypothetical protein